MNEPEVKRVKIEDLRSGPIRHDELPDVLLQRIQVIHKMVGHYLGMNLEQFEVGFMRDIDPEHEVAVWCRIAAGWYLYHRQFTDLQRLPSDEEKKLIGALSLISMGVEDDKELGVTAKTAARLRACYDQP